MLVPDLDINELEGNPIWENMKKSDLEDGKMLLFIRKAVKKGLADPIAVWACVRDSTFFIPVNTTIPQEQIDYFKRGKLGSEGILDLDINLRPMIGTDEYGNRNLMIYTNRRMMPRKRSGYTKTLELDFESCYRALDRWNLSGMIWDSEKENILIDRNTAAGALAIPSRLVRSKQPVSAEDADYRC